MVSEYTVELCKDGISFPLNDVGGSPDTKLIGSDARNHIREVAKFSGPETCEYGGESPWIHQWFGTIRVPESEEDEKFLLEAVDELLRFFDSSCTPHNTTVDDFDWNVQISTSSAGPRPSESYSVLVSWEPT